MRLTGKDAEQLAARFLTQQGLAELCRNYHCRGGEIDLIMRDGDVTVFVEVRRRRHRAFGGAAASIGPDKQRRIARTAQIYLSRTFGDCDLPVRFDVVAIDGAQSELRWLRSAFDVS